jgi:hypothetical protein
MSDQDLLNTAPEGGDTTPAPAEASAPATAAPAGMDVNQFMTEGWRDCIPEDLRERSEWSRVSNVQDVFKNYISAQQTISKSVRIPDATSSAEDVTAFYSKLGKPASAAEYDFTYNKPEGASFGKESFDFSVFQDIADKANLTKDQYQALASAYVDIQNDYVSKYNESVASQAGAEMKQSEDILRKEWGKDYASNINNISSKITQMYPQETIDRMAASGLFRDSNFLKSQLALTKMMTGDTIFIEGRGVENVPQTIEDLRAKRDSLMSADYVKNKAQVTELNKQIVQLQMAQQGQLGRLKG